MYIQGLFQSRLGTADYAQVTSSLLYNDSLVTWTVKHMTAAKCKPLYIFCVGLLLVQCSEQLNFHDFGWLLLVACMILLCNHKRTVYEKPYAYREPMCASENCQWCGEPNIAVSSISIGDVLPQIPSQSSFWCQAPIWDPRPIFLSLRFSFRQLLFVML
jgi:hypothetical protein